MVSGRGCVEGSVPQNKRDGAYSDVVTGVVTFTARDVMGRVLSVTSPRSARIAVLGDRSSLRHPQCHIDFGRQA